MRTMPSASPKTASPRPPNATQSTPSPSSRGRNAYAGRCSTRVQVSNRSWLSAALCSDAPNAIAEASRQAAPPATRPHVAGVTLPARGSRQCFTLTTESPSIAATSIARAAPGSSVDSARTCDSAAGRTAVSSGRARAGAAAIADGGLHSGSAGRGAASITPLMVAVCARGTAAASDTVAAALPRARDGIGGGAAGALDEDATDDRGEAAADAIGGGAPAALGEDATGDRGQAAGDAIVGDAADAIDGGAAARSFAGPADGSAVAAAASGTGAASRIAISMRVSPTVMVSPVSSRALLIFLPLTNVPRVDPRSIRWTSRPVTSTI